MGGQEDELDAAPRSLQPRLDRPWVMGAGIVGLRFRGSRPARAGAWRGKVAHLTGGLGVVGSNPAALTNFFKGLAGFG